MDNWVVSGTFTKIRNIEIGENLRGKMTNFFWYIFIMYIKENATM